MKPQQDVSSPRKRRNKRKQSIISEAEVVSVVPDIIKYVGLDGQYLALPTGDVIDTIHEERDVINQEAIPELRQAKLFSKFARTNKRAQNQEYVVNIALIDKEAAILENEFVPRQTDEMRKAELRRIMKRFNIPLDKYDTKRQATELENFESYLSNAPSPYLDFVSNGGMKKTLIKAKYMKSDKQVEVEGAMQRCLDLNKKQLDEMLATKLARKVRIQQARDKKLEDERIQRLMRGEMDSPELKNYDQLDSQPIQSLNLNVQSNTQMMNSTVGFKEEEKDVFNSPFKVRPQSSRLRSYTEVKDPINFKVESPGKTFYSPSNKYQKNIDPGMTRYQTVLKQMEQSGIIKPNTIMTDFNKLGIKLSQQLGIGKNFNKTTTFQHRHKSVKMPSIKEVQKMTNKQSGSNQFNTLVKNSLITAIPSSKDFGQNRFLSPSDKSIQQMNTTFGGLSPNPSGTGINFMTQTRNSASNLALGQSPSHKPIPKRTVVEPRKPPPGDRINLSPDCKYFLSNYHKEQKGDFSNTTERLKMKQISPKEPRIHNFSQASRTVLPNVLKNGYETHDKKIEKKQNMHSNLGKKIDPNTVILDNIMQQIHNFTGKRGDETVIQTLNKHYLAREVEQEFVDNYQAHTAEIIQQFDQYPPKVAKWMIENEFNWVKNHSNDQRKSVIDFDKQRIDIPYIKLLENSTKKVEKTKTKQIEIPT